MPLSNNTFDFAIPSIGTGFKATPRQQVVQFGGGYKDVRGDGINNVPREWPIQFNDVPRAAGLLMDQFLTAKADGSTFQWTAPPPYDSAPRTVRIKPQTDWDITWDKAGLNCSLTVTVEDV